MLIYNINLITINNAALYTWYFSKIVQTKFEQIGDQYMILRNTSDNTAMKKKNNRIIMC